MNIAPVSDDELAQQCSDKLHSMDECAQTLNISIDYVKAGQAKLSMVVDQRYANGFGHCQGGIITTLADTAFAHACNSYNKVTVAQGLSIEFVRPAKVGDTLTATAIEVSRGRVTGVYKTKVFNSHNNLVALFVGKSYELDNSIL